MLPLKKSERIEKMKSEFMKYYYKNWSIARIASYFVVSKPTISRYIGEIATANGLSREEMMEHFKSIRN